MRKKLEKFKNNNQEKVFANTKAIFKGRKSLQVFVTSIEKVVKIKRTPQTL